MDLPLAVNPSGCARCEPRFRTLIKHRRRNQPPAATARSYICTDVLSRDTRSLLFYFRYKFLVLELISFLEIKKKKLRWITSAYFKLFLNL